MNYGERLTPLSIIFPSPAKILSDLPAKTGWRGDTGVRYNVRFKPENPIQILPGSQRLEIPVLLGYNENCIW